MDDSTCSIGDLSKKPQLALVVTEISGCCHPIGRSIKGICWALEGMEMIPYSLHNINNIN
jgi:hypothetical protein